MSDLTICVMLPPRGDTTYDRSAHSKMPVLAPVCVYPRQEIAEVTAPRTGYIHVSDCPVKDPRELAEKLCAVDEREVFVSEQRLTQTLAKRVYEADVSQLPAKVQAALLAERQCSLTWAEFAAMYGHRETNEKLADVVKTADAEVRG